MQRMRNNRIQHLYFVGIGGAGMSGIAEVLHENGFKISGSDTGNGPVIQYLKSLGIQIFPEHKGENIGNADLLVYSSAIQKDNPEIQEAQNRRIPIIRRAEMLGELMRLKYTLAIAGTHGKGRRGRELHRYTMEQTTHQCSFLWHECCARMHIRRGGWQ